MTLSLVAADPTTGEVGVAITSSSPAVAARCAHVRAGVGAVATQNVTDPRLGPALLDRLAAGVTAAEALHDLVVAQPVELIAFRQVTCVTPDGHTALFSGDHALGVVGQHQGNAVVSAGNLLASTQVPQLAVAAFEAAAGPLATRLLVGLNAGMAAGGEAGPVHSAGLVCAREVAWAVTDLRVDWADEDPVGELTALWRRWEPELEGYVTRALHPGAAPAYGVPGDE